VLIDLLLQQPAHVALDAAEHLLDVLLRQVGR
jgi:hypothetical protein